MTDVTVRPASLPDDLPALQRLSPPEIKPVVDFYVHATLVAEIGGELAGYTQFCVTPDKVLHSTAIRIGAEWKGRGIGQQLMDAKVELAKQAGAQMHYYAVDPDGEAALKKILEHQGMRLLCKRVGVWVYVQDLAHE